MNITCDVAIALFNPFKFKVYNQQGLYKGYNVKNRMINQYGHNRFRLLSILKNSYGAEDISYGLKFLGEVMHFETLPRVEETEKLERIYNQIALGL